MNPVDLVLEGLRAADVSPSRRRRSAIRLLAYIYDAGSVNHAGVPVSVLARIAAHRPGSTFATVLAEAHAELAETEAHPADYPTATMLLAASEARKEGQDARALRHLADLLDDAMV